MRMAKLFVPSGTPVHDNCGDTFWPTQFGLFDKLLATFLGIIWPSLKVVDVKVNGSAARTVAAIARTDRKSTRLNSSHTVISYAVFCLKKKNNIEMSLCGSGVVLR